MIHIDGSYGEGGGQILRTSLALSSILQQPIHLYNIRKRRKRPGLMAQHLMCVRALKEITSADVEGDAKGSEELYFFPKRCVPGNYSFNIGTAGSITLFLQSVLPVLIFQGEQSTVEVTGGTHVPFSPTFDYFNEVFLFMLKRIGFDVRSDIFSYGFYPEGGGRVKVEIKPMGEVRRLELTERGKIMGVYGTSAVGGLSLEIAERQKQRAESVLGSAGITPEIECKAVSSPGKGTYIFLKTVANNVTSGFSSLGAKGKRAERVGEEAAWKLVEYIKSNACLDPYLSDQILPYIALIGGRWIFSTAKITEHLKTNLWVIGRFIDFKYKLEGNSVELFSSYSHRL